MPTRFSLILLFICAHLHQQAEAGEAIRIAAAVTVSTSEIAETMTRVVDSELSLDDRQLRKVYKVHLKDAKDAQRALKFSREAERYGIVPYTRSGEPLPRVRERHDRAETYTVYVAGTEEMVLPSPASFDKMISRFLPEEPDPEKNRVRRNKKMQKILTAGQYMKWLQSEEKWAFTLWNITLQNHIKQ